MASKINGCAHKWPEEPDAYSDFPLLQHGQSYEDWSTSQDRWLASLSPTALSEVIAYQSDVNKFLRMRTWRKRRELVVSWGGGIIAVYLLVGMFDLLETGASKTLPTQLLVGNNAAMESKLQIGATREMR